MSETHAKAGRPVRREPIVAAAASLLLPGMGHLLLGRTRQALQFFLLIEGLYGLGLWLSKGTIFSLSGAAALAPGSSRLWMLFLMPIPELLNVGGTLLGSLFFLQEAQIPLLEISFLQGVGACLCAASGMLCFFVAVDAWTGCSESSASARSAFQACALSWMVPGAGHWWLGRRFHGWFFFGVVNATYLLGFLLGGGLVVDRERFFYYWAGQFLNGGTTLLATLGTLDWRIDRPLPWLDAGVLFTTVAGLINVIVILSAYAVAQEKET